MRVDHIGSGPREDLWIAVELQGEIKRRTPGPTGERDRVVAPPGDRIDMDAKPFERIAHPVHDDALTAKQLIVVLAGDRDAGHR